MDHGLQKLAELALDDHLPSTLDTFPDTKLLLYLLPYIAQPATLLTVLRQAHGLITGSIVLAIALGTIAWSPGDLDILVEAAGLQALIAFFEANGYVICEVSHCKTPGKCVNHALW